MITIWADNLSRYTLPTPSSMEWEFNDIDKDSGRNDLGVMMRERLASKRKITLTWNSLKNKVEYSKMLKVFESLPPFLFIEFPDPNGNMVTMECYRGNLKTSVYKYNADTYSIWKGTSTSFIER